MVEEAAAFLSATSATLFILDRENGMLWARRRGLPGTPDAGALQVKSNVLPDNDEVEQPASCCVCVISVTVVAVVTSFLCTSSAFGGG